MSKPFCHSHAVYTNITTYSYTIKTSTKLDTFSCCRRMSSFLAFHTTFVRCVDPFAAYMLVYHWCLCHFSYDCLGTSKLSLNIYTICIKCACVCVAGWVCEVRCVLSSHYYGVCSCAIQLFPFLFCFLPNHVSGLMYFLASS